MKTFERSTPLADIDPAWAWQPWEPSAAEPWNTRRAALLFRRAGFCASGAELESAVRSSPQAVVDKLLRPDNGDQVAMESFERESATIARAVLATGNAARVSTWWLHRMLHSPRPLVEKMTLFWHGHFATGAEKVLDPALMHGQNQLLREHALGDFRALVHAICKDPAMLIYLDSATNRKAKANENFARELMELFCLGEGQYSEADVQQLARCFTGWEIRRGQFRFNPYQHDNGIKTLFGQEVRSGEEAVDRVLTHHQLPFFIARKLVRFFVLDEPEPDDHLITPLARRFAEDELNLSGLVQTILSSRLLLSDWSGGRKIRAPVEMAIGMMRCLQATANLNRLSDHLRDVGQAVFYPPNVKGWDGGRAWIQTSSLVGRANLVHQFVRDENTRFAGGSIEAFAAARWGGQAETMIDWLTEMFLAVPITAVQRQQIVSTVAGKSEPQLTREALSLFATFPQFHLA